ncbi:MAG: acyl carrier protein [Defluviitaleaceae bacterium]|nr:acyl carrier protein [Defluviitaleaceae bacterium]
MVFDKVREVISGQLGIAEDKIKMTTSFTDDLGADSLDIFQVVSELEEIFDLEFSNEDAEKIKVIADAVKYIEDRIE